MWSWNHAWIGHALKRRPLGETDTFDAVCFLFAFLSRISNAKNCKVDTASDGKRFQFSDKKATSLQGHFKNFRNSEKPIIKLDIFFNFLKRKHFLHFKTGMILFDFILQFWRSTILLSRTLYLFLHVALCNQPTVALRHWR